jgi:hypothetical protein
MDYHGSSITSQHTAADETVLSTQPQNSDPDEEGAQDIVSWEAARQQVNTWNFQTPFQGQHSSGLLSQPGQEDLGVFTGWDNYLFADFMAGPMPLQVANDTNSHTTALQTPALSSTGWMDPNALQPGHDLAGQHTCSDYDIMFDDTTGPTLNTSACYTPTLDSQWQSINFEAIQQPVFSPYASSTRSTTAFTGHPATLDPAPSELLRIPQTPDILASGPFDFAEIERQALQSSDLQMWKRAAQIDGSSFDSTSLDALRMPDLTGVGDHSAYGYLPPPPNQMVLPTRGHGSTLSVTTTSTSARLPIAPKPHVGEIAPATHSQSQALVRLSILPRKSSAQPTSKLRALHRPDKQRRKRQKVGVESQPGYQEFSLASHTVVRAHNSRFGKKLDPVAKMTREKGACIICRHHNKKVCRMSADAYNFQLIHRVLSAIGLLPMRSVLVASR